MRQSYFISAMFFWVIGFYFFKEAPKDCGNRLYVNEAAPAGGDGSSWETAFKYLQDALSQANSCANVSEIWVAKGIYYPDEGNGFIDNVRGLSFVMKNGLAIYGGFNGSESSIAERNVHIYHTYLSGDLMKNSFYSLDDNGNFFNNNDDNAYHVVVSLQTDQTSILDGFIIAAGNANGSNNNAGGGLYAVGSSMVVANCEFRHNRSDKGGGLYHTQSSILFDKCIFRANSVTTEGGGAFITDGSDPYFYNCIFQANYVNENTAAGRGGGTFVSLNSYPQFINCTFKGNYARTGGAVYATDNVGTTFYNSIIWRNQTRLPKVYEVDQVVSANNSSADYYNSILQFIDLPDENNNLDGVDPKFTVDLVHPDPAPQYFSVLTLEPCSPAIDHGNNGYLASETDVAGNPRFVNTTVDLGAFEFQGTNGITYYQDLDGDGWGNDNVSVVSCSPPPGYVTRGGDCNDVPGDDIFTDGAAVNPGLLEVCGDLLDNDCNGLVDDLYTYYRDADGDGLGNIHEAIGRCTQEIPEGYVENHDDCNDADNSNSGTVIYVNVNASGPIQNGTSWATAYKNLQDALKYSCPNITQLWVAQGTYYPDKGVGRSADAQGEFFEMKNGLGIYGGFAGDETQLSQRNWKTNITILSGDVNEDGTLYGNSYNIIFNDGNSLTNSAKLDGFYVMGGNAMDQAFSNLSGAGIRNINSNPFVANCVFENNSAVNFGAAVYNAGTAGGNTSIFENCLFRNNIASGGLNSSGGAVYNAGRINLINCAFFNNACAKQGGAIWNSGSLQVVNGSFFDNRSTTNGKHIFSNSTTEANIVNSILWGTNSPIDATSATVNYSVVQQASGTYPGVGNLNIDPLFIDAANGDLRLNLLSPAINAGSDAANGTEKDLDVNPRKFGVIDMGAYEFGSSVPGCTDEIAPTFTSSYEDVTLGCNPANPEGSLGTATATDASGTVTITSSDGSVVSDGCDRSITRTFTAIDGCNNTSTASRTVRWISDVTPPVFTGNYEDVNRGCNPADPNGSLGSASATDACGAVTVTQTDGAVISDGCNRSRTRTFTAKDGCSNTSTTSRTVTWKVDITPPRITCPANMELVCNATIPGPNVEAVTVSDDCPGDITVSFVSDVVNTVSCLETTTRTYRATDVCGNTATCTQTITRKVDLSPPTITCPANLSLGCGAEIPAPNTGSVTVGDGCPGVITVQHISTILQDISNCGETWIRRYKATDACGYTATCAQTITRKVDLSSPTITCPANLSLGCGAEIPAPNTGSVTVGDGCPGEITVQHVSTILQGTSNCVETWIRRYKATDECGNTASCSQTITRTVDINPPAFAGSYADVNLGCNPANPDGSLGSASATDACGAVNITSEDGSVVSNGCYRSITRIFTAKDDCNNTATISRTVTWIFDDTPPEFTGSYADINLGCNPAYPEGALGTATATDACGDVTITSTGLGTEYDGCNRSITRRFFAKDQCGNRSTITRTVRWIVELSPPTFTGGYADVNLGCNPADPQGSLGTATATDVCGAVAITSIDGSVVSNGCNRSITRTFTATDGCLNTSSTSRTVRWLYDKTSPTLTCAQTGTVTKSTSTDQCSYTVNGAEFDPTASDACGTPSLGWVVTGATSTSGITTMAGLQLNFGYNTIKWTATDGCNNTSTCSFIVHVNKITTTTSLVVSTTPATNPVTQQYSDKIKCVATVTPANCAGAGPIGGTVTFKIITTEGTVVLGSAPVGSDGKATLEDTLLENQFYPGATNLLPSNGPLKPGNKTVTAVYSDTDPDYMVTNPTAPLVVTCEDADITYNGLNYFGANPNTNQGTITVSAFVLDANDVPAQARGDIRNATVTFKEGSSAGTVIGSSNIPVGLVNPTNFQEGIVTTNKTYTLTTQDINCGGKILDVWAGVNNYYCGEIGEVVPVCLSLPGGDFVTGGGWIKMQNSEGSYAGTDDKKMHAAIVFKWNKSNKNLQGNATIVYKRVVNGIQKVYQIKSNSITSMIVNNVNDAGTVVTTGATYRMAQIVTKANFRDLTDPDFPITLFGNLTLTITAWESINTTDGSKDRISVQLVGSGSQGLIFSSNWVNGATLWQHLGSGKMRVRNPSLEIPCNNCSGSGITAKNGEVDKATEALPGEDLKAVVMPNPSSTNFRIVVSGNNVKDRVKLFVTDMYGRVIETRTTYTGQTITLGEKYISGTYAVRIIQGKKIKQLTLIKISD